MIGTKINKMRLLLTGASGFLGKNFMELAPKDIEITGIYNSSKNIKNFVEEKKLSNVKLYKCDFTKKEEVEKLFKKIGKDFDYCLYLAANVNVPLSVKDPKQDFKITVTGLVNFLERCKNINRLVYMSSTAVYDGNKGPVTVKTKLNPKVPYCKSKFAAELYVRSFFEMKKIKNYAVIRFGGAFGPYSEKKFMSKLVKDIFVENKKEIEVYGDGANIINVMYVKDTIKALLACLKSKKLNVTCNLGQDNRTITDTVKNVAKAFGKQVKIKYTPKIKEQKYIGFEIDWDFNEIFNFNPEYSFEEGIKEFGKSMKNEN
ncbi:hypothetical protein CMO93_05865 [Candidatus Woesearchaeota archaeon]|nr:hypothetical protein [Candidatus Woesearchaeota archaeon]